MMPGTAEMGPLDSANTAPTLEQHQQRGTQGGCLAEGRRPFGWTICCGPGPRFQWSTNCKTVHE